MKNSYLIIFIATIFSITSVTSQETDEPFLDITNFSDGPYVFISNNKLIEKKILNGKVTSKVLEPTLYDTIFTPQKSIYKNVENIAALSDKSKVETAETTNKTDKVTQDQQKNIDSAGLSLSEEDALKAQIFGCWSIPLGLPYNENLLVRIKLQLNPDGTVSDSEILDHARMNKPGQGFYKVLAESALRAVKLCQPLRVPTTGYERWKELQLNFDAREMLEG